VRGPGADIALYLARHGARVEVEQVLSQGARSPTIILSYAAEHGVDLIVIGAYSHARPVEMMFGGVTRTLLKEAPVPVLDVTVSEFPSRQPESACAEPAPAFMHVATSGRTLGTAHTAVRFRKLYVSIVSIFELQNRLLISVG